MQESIIKNTNAYKDYSINTIDAESLNIIRQASINIPKWLGDVVESLIICLECFNQVTGQALILNNKFMSESQLNIFIGALNSDKFIKGSMWKKYLMTKALLALLVEIKKNYAELTIPDIRISTTTIDSELIFWIKKFEETVLHEDKVWLWRGWYSESKDGRGINFPLYNIYKKLGKEFAQSFYEACDKYYRGRANHKIACLSDFVKFIHQYKGKISAKKFEDSIFVKEFLEEFLVFWIKEGMAKGKQPACMSEEWRHQFIRFFKDYLVGPGLFVEPLGAMPSPKPIRMSGQDKKIKITVNGKMVKTKLLTHIDLHLTQKEAIEQLLFKIKFDKENIEKWAEFYCNDLWRRYERRLEYENQGKVRIIQKKGVNSGAHKWINNRENPKHLENSAATFKFHGYLRSTDQRIELLYPKPLHQAAHDLALPITNALLPHCALLVIEHPLITPSFLENLKLYDNNNKLVGFIGKDVGTALVGYKRRKGAEKAEQKITLTKKSEKVVRQIIAITEPLRSYLRAKNDPNWRYLLLTCKNGFAQPDRYKRLTQKECGRTKKMAGEISHACHLSESQALDLANKFSLCALRATMGVLKYLETKSVEAMAAELGHDQHSPELIDHYLPKQIVDFFRDREIRIFQNGIITTSMKQSKNLLLASDFKNMDELNTFLRNHVLELIPSHLIPPGLRVNIATRTQIKTDSKVLFGLDVGILSALISLHKAVVIATRPVSETARFWSDITEKLISYIDTQLVSRPDIQHNLKLAEMNLNVDAFSEFIYEI